MATSRFLRLALLFVTILGAAVSSPPASISASSLVMLGGFPTLRQQHSLTCESSAASMGTRGALSESRIMAAMAHNADPNLGFRGSPDGQEVGALHDYGVYAAPVGHALGRLGYHADVLMYAYDATIKSYIRRGWPVVVWITYALQHEVPRLDQSRGVRFILVPHEHAVLAIGFDASTVIANDPWTGQQVRYRWRDFNQSWGLFGNMALAIAPCHVPGTVTGLRVAALNTDQLAFTWQSASNATSYAVKIVQRGSRDSTAFQGVATTTTASIPNPKAGASYEISVQARGSCGVTASSSRRLWVQLPAILPQSTTPTPLPTPPTAEQTVVAPSATPTTSVPTSTSTPTSAAAATVTALPTSTPHH